ESQLAVFSSSVFRVLHERKRENRKHEDPPEERHSPREHVLRNGGGPRGAGSKAKGTGEEDAAEESPLLGKAAPRHDAKGNGIPALESSPPTTKNFHIYDVPPFFPLSCADSEVGVAHLPQQGPFRHWMDAKVEEKLTGWKERRSRFGDINVHKCYQFGKIFSPFQALATTEMRRLVFPRELPVSSHMQTMGASCFGDMTLQDSPLCPTQLGLGKNANSHDEEKAAGHIKVPLFPPIFNAKKYDMK
uniref:Uncharacterized protein n=1 Tax=Jaculus jaculus TaxID=51337 RepID=A0A8C5L342_JACJA